MKRTPVLGPAFDQDQTNDYGRVQNYLAELRYYRPRGFSKLAKEGEKILRDIEKSEESFFDEWATDIDSLLTEWARRVTRNDYISFGPFEHTGDVGFYIAVDLALEDGARFDDLADVPKGFSGLVCIVNDHGNVTAYNFSNGRRTREIFAVV